MPQKRITFFSTGLLLLVLGLAQPSERLFAGLVMIGAAAVLISIALYWRWR